MASSSIRSPTETFSQSHLLRQFVPANRHLFPVQVRVLEYDEPVTVLDHHQVEAGSQLVLHGWTRQPKILAVCGQRHYAIPLSYAGEFRVVARTFKGLSGLEYSIQKKQRLRVIEANPDSEDGILAVREGDLIEAIGERVVQGQGQEFIGCERTDQHTGQMSQVFLSTSCDLTFEEVIEDLPVAGEGHGLYHIRDFVSALDERSFDVELVEPGPDHIDPKMELPLDSPINLRKHVIEPAVYASLDTSLGPAFHIPMRATIFIRFMRQLPRGCSPLLNKQNARLSTLDRCVELLTPEIFNEIIINQKHFLQLFQSRPKGSQILPAAGQRGRRRLSSSQSQLDSLESSSIRKGPGSVTGSVRSFSAESMSSRIKSRFGFKFKRSKSSAGSDFGSVKSLPVTSNKKSNRLQFLVSSGDRLGSGPMNRNQANQKDFRFPDFQNRPRVMMALPANQKQSLIAPANHTKAPYNGGVSQKQQKQSTNDRLVRVVVNGDADEDDEDDDEEVSTNQGEPRSKSPPRNKEKAEAFSQSVNSVKSISESTNHKVEIAHKGRANQNADLKVSANQKIAPPSSVTDDVAPVQRSTLNPPRRNGYDVTAGASRDVHRRNSVSSTDAVSLQSISGSISSNSSNSNRNTNNGTGSILSSGSGGSILKKSSHHSQRPPPPRQQLQQQQQTTDNETKQPQIDSTSFKIPPGFALVPLNPEQSAIPPGFALVPANEAKQMQQQQLPQKQTQTQKLPQQQLQQQQQFQQRQQLQQQQMHQQQLEQQKLQQQQLQKQQLQQQQLQKQQLQQQQLQQQQLEQQKLQQQQLQQQQLQHQQLQQQQPNGLASSTSSALVSNERTLRQVTFDNETIDSDSDVLGSTLNLNGRLSLPADANLYGFSVKKFTEFLVCLNLDESVIRACKKHRIDGKKFSRMTDQDLEKRGLLQPIVLYFRKHTNKRLNFNA